MILGWTAAVAVLICAAILAVLGLLALTTLLLSPGRVRTALQVLLALLGLLVAVLLAW